MKKIFVAMLLLTTIDGWCGSINCLCIGQSNMCGRGMAEPYTQRAYDKIYNWRNGAFELITEPSCLTGPYQCSSLTAIGNQLCKYFGRDIYMLQCAQGSTGLHAGPDILWKSRGANTLFQKSLDTCTKSGIVPNVIFFFQGESDILESVDSADYYNDLIDLVDDYRSYFNNPHLPFIMVKLGYVASALDLKVRPAQAHFGETENIDNRTITGLESLSMGDQYHYTTSSLEIIGTMLANSYITWSCTCK
jgi:hypothetical protein